MLQRMHNRCLKGLDVTSTQFSFMTCLVYLCESGPVTPSRVVAFTGMDKMMVSDLIKTLQRKRLIRLKRNPQDGRSFLIAPTREGQIRTNSAVREIEAVDEEFFGGVRDMKKFHTALLALVRKET